MENHDQLMRVVAVMSAKNGHLSQSERANIIRLHGVDAAMDRVFGDQLFACDEALKDAEDVVRQWREQGVKVVSILDESYPHTLATVHQAPALLFYEGRLLSEDRGIAVVGSRQITPRQSEIACAIASRVVQRGRTVVSGLALGVDSSAHWEALRQGGRTVAVMGTPIERTYPRENKELREKLVGSGGLVLSQFLPGASVGRFAFPMRNITMSGYAECTVIVAATENSGTRHQALAAHRHGRSLILLDEVVKNVSWAADLAARPGVYTVAGIKDFDNAICAIERDRELLGSYAPEGAA